MLGKYLWVRINSKTSLPSILLIAIKCQYEVWLVIKYKCPKCGSNNIYKESKQEYHGKSGDLECGNCGYCHHPSKFIVDKNE